MGLFNFRRNKDPDELFVSLRALIPWEHARSPILDHIRRHTAADGSLAAAGQDLPDESPEPGQLRWAPGAMDGVWGTHGQSQEMGDMAARIRTALKNLSLKPDLKNARNLYGLLMEQSALSTVDTVLETLIGGWPVPAEHLRAIALWLIAGSPDRDPVKFAIAILGISTSEVDRDLIHTLGLHEEFTIYSILALRHSASSTESGDESIWRLGQKVAGWGRVHAVSRLEETASADIQRWLVTEGCQNTIMSEYTALICANTGRLADRITHADAHLDLPLLDGASEILTALLRIGGPAPDVRAYEPSLEVVSAFLDCIDRTPNPSLTHLRAMQSIRDFLAAESTDWSEGSLAAWTAARRESIAAQSHAIIAKLHWRALVNTGLAAADDSHFWTAAELAPLVGIDPWDHRFERLQRGSDQWFSVMQTTDPDRIDKVLNHALATIPLDRLPGPPSEELWPTGIYARHYQSLDWIVSYLKPFPGKGWPLIRTALQSPYTRHRNMAAMTLKEWPRESLPADARAHIEQAIARERVPETAALMKQLLTI